VDANELTRTLSRDVDAHFEQLVVAFQDRIYAFALRLCGQPPDAEEIAQDTFVRAYRALVDYTPDRIEALALRPWLYQIALNVFRNSRRGRRLTLVPMVGADGEPVLDPEDDARERPEQQTETREIRATLAAALTALPTTYRVAVVLRHVEGLSYGEAATLLGQPVGTVKSNVHRGTKLLREKLSVEALA
jgi:RNA polymerase sigma-70 factor (ECF subfamily)